MRVRANDAALRSYALVQEVSGACRCGAVCYYGQVVPLRRGAAAHAVAATVDGIAAQAAIKVVTHQHVPLCNTFLLDADPGASTICDCFGSTWTGLLCTTTPTL